MKRELHLTVVIAHEALAGIVQYMRSEKIYVRSMSEAVGLAVEMLYGTLVDEGLISPVGTQEQGRAQLEVFGLRNQKIEKRGLLKIAKTEVEEENLIAQYMREYNMTESGAREFIALESGLKVESRIRKKEEVGEVGEVGEILPKQEREVTRQKSLREIVSLKNGMGSQNGEDEIDRLRRKKDSRPVISAIPPEMLEQMKRDEEAREKGEEG